jgi:hypothetical protein
MGVRIRSLSVLARSLFVGAVLAGAGVPASASAFSYPGFVSSWYMNSVDTTTHYNMGCTLGASLAGGASPQDALVILDYGQAQLRGGVYGTYAFGGRGYVTVDQIRAAVVEYGHGFWSCTGANTSAHLRIGIGTSNYADFGRGVGMTDAQVVSFGAAWAVLVNQANDGLTSLGYARQVDAVAASDIELSWGTAATARGWFGGYNGSFRWPMYNYGDAAGCRWSGTTATAGGCNNGWTQRDVYYVAWGAAPAYAVPEIYATNGVNAKQWQQVSKWGTLNGGSRIWFSGSLTQAGACASGGCSGVDNSPSAGWTYLVNACAVDSATTLSSLRFAADIKAR